MSENKELLEVKDLGITFFTDRGALPAVQEVSFSIKPGETLGVVGESGCGKSMTALSLMQLIPSPPGKITAGEIMYKGEDLLKKSPKEMRYSWQRNLNDFPRANDILKSSYYCWKTNYGSCFNS